MPKELNLLYTVDDAYIPLLSVSLASVVYNNKEADITIYIATDKDENTDNFKKLKAFYKDIKIKHLDCKEHDKTFDSLKLNKWGSKSYYIYWRYVALNKLECDKVIYLDADILCLKEIDFPKLNNKSSGCVIDSVHSIYNKLLNLDKDFCFFNTGTLFVDVNKWKKNDCTNKILNAMKSDKPFIMADQDYYSYALENDVEIIDPKYNYFVGYDYYGVDNTYDIYKLDDKKFYTKSELIKAKEDIVFYHCLDGVFKRPWTKGNFSPIKEKYEFYRKLACFNDFSSDGNVSLLMKIEHSLEILPSALYNKLHSLAIKRYIKNSIKNINR